MRKNRYISFVLLFVLIITLWNSVSVNAEEVQMGSNDEKRDYLLTIGAPKEYVNLISNEKLNVMYDILKSGDYKFSDWEQKIVEVEEGSQTRGNIPTTKLQLYIATFDNVKNGTVQNVYVSLGYTWLQYPIAAYTDAMTFNWDGHLFSLAGFYAVNNGGNEVGSPVIDNVSAPAKSASGGIGWYMRQADPNFGYVAKTGAAELLLKPKTTISATSNLNSDMHFNYAHALLGIGLSFGVSGSGLSAGISVESGLYDEQAAYYVYH